MSEAVKKALGCADPNAEVIGVYFSADYCKWCKEFTPKLSEMYPNLRLYNIDVVFVGSDKTENAFDTYRAQQPWPAVGYNDSARWQLRNEFQIKTIPALVFLNRDGNVVLEEGRFIVDSAYESSDVNQAVEEVASRLGVCPFSYDSDSSDF